MKNLPTLPTVALSLVLAAAGTMSVVMAPAPAFAAAKAQTVSPKVYKAVKEIGDLLDKNDNQGALAKSLEASKIPDMTPFETNMVEDYLGRAYLGLQDYANAAAAFDASFATGAMPADAKASRFNIITQLYLQIGNYQKAIDYGTMYLKDIGKDADMEGLLGQAYYLNKNTPQAMDALHDAIALADAAKTPAKEEWFHYLERAEADKGNITGVIAAEEQVVQRFPSKDSWSALLTNVSNNIKGSDKVTLDISRLMLAAGVMKGSSDYMEMAKLDLQQQLPGEAKQVLQKGFDAGVLGTGLQKAEANQLLAKATAAADADLKSIGAGAKEASTQKTGDAQIRFGEAYTTYGQYDQAISTIQSGISKGVKDMDDAQLRLGLAYLGAGKKTEALAAFKAITSNSPTAQVAQLWAIFIANPPPA